MKKNRFISSVCDTIVKNTHTIHYACLTCVLLCTLCAVIMLNASFLQCLTYCHAGSLFESFFYHTMELSSMYSLRSLRRTRDDWPEFEERNAGCRMFYLLQRNLWNLYPSKPDSHEKRKPARISYKSRVRDKNVSLGNNVSVKCKHFAATGKFPEKRSHIALACRINFT